MSTYLQGSFSWSKVTVGMRRHDTLACRPGFYRVTICAYEWVDCCCFDAVCDDFGNLVKVSA